MGEWHAPGGTAGAACSSRGPAPSCSRRPSPAAGVSGYVSASYYRQMEGTKWVTNLLLTCSVFCAPLFVMFAINNTVAIVYGVSGRAGRPGWPAGSPCAAWRSEAARHNTAQRGAARRDGTAQRAARRVTAP